jgi:hypothetical protein
VRKKLPSKHLLDERFEAEIEKKSE